MTTDIERMAAEIQTHIGILADMMEAAGDERSYAVRVIKIFPRREWGTSRSMEHFFMDCLSMWISIRMQWEDRFKKDTNISLIQVSADIAHSALLQRLMKGKKPLPEPPPRSYSYPWYDLIELGEGFHCGVYLDQHLDQLGNIAINQNSEWRILERRSAQEFIVQHFPGKMPRGGKYRLWSVAMLDGRPDWTLKRIE